jgi:hypothetical protein
VTWRRGRNCGLPTEPRSLSSAENRTEFAIDRISPITTLLDEVFYQEGKKEKTRTA